MCLHLHVHMEVVLIIIEEILYWWTKFKIYCHIDGEFVRMRCISCLWQQWSTEELVHFILQWSASSMSNSSYTNIVCGVNMETTATQGHRDKVFDKQYIGQFYRMLWFFVRNISENSFVTASRMTKKKTLSVWVDPIKLKIFAPSF